MVRRAPEFSGVGGGHAFFFFYIGGFSLGGGLGVRGLGVCGGLGVRGSGFMVCKASGLGV